MDRFIPVVGTVALLAAALVGGIFFAFSSFIMKALARVPDPSRFFRHPAMIPATFERLIA